MNSLTEIIIGVFIFGILTVIVGYVSGFIVGKLNQRYISKDCINCKDWNKNHVMEITLFLTGAIVWLISFYISRIPKN